MSDVEAKVYGDAAIVTFYWVVRLTSKGKTQSVHGRGTHVYVLKGDQWKIVHEHFSRAHHAS